MISSRVKVHVVVASGILFIAPACALAGAGTESGVKATESFQLRDILTFVSTIIGLVWAIFSWFYQTRATELRAKIKADLEILEKIKLAVGEEHPSTKLVTKHLVYLITLQYSIDPSKSVRSIGWSDLALGAVLWLGALGWISFNPLKDHWGNIVFAGLLAFVGVGAFINAFNPKARQPGAA